MDRLEGGVILTRTDLSSSFLIIGSIVGRACSKRDEVKNPDDARDFGR